MLEVKIMKIRHRFSVSVLAYLMLGSASTATSKSQGRPGPEDFVYVCRDAGAGGYEAFPDVCRLRDGRLIAVFYAGYGHVSLPNERLPRGGRISYCVSDDGGRTWSVSKPIGFPGHCPYLLLGAPMISGPI